MDLGQCLKGTVAFVTGSGSGIGRAVAEFAARSGSAVGCSDIDESKARQTADAISAAGGTAFAVNCDVQQFDHLAAACDATAARYGGLDTVFACAGVYPAVAFEAIDDSHWDRVLNLNLKGVYYSIKAALPHLTKRGGGQVVITSSITGNRVGYPGLSAYSAAKAGINGLIKSVALELAPLKIRVNGVEPGTVRTPGVEGLGEATISRIAREIPMRRLASAGEIAGPTIFLASAAASYITGQTIIVDGGRDSSRASAFPILGRAMSLERPERIEIAPGIEASRVVVGLWQVADMERDGRQLDPDLASDELAQYVRAGFDSFDMADHYGSAELIVGALSTQAPERPGPGVSRLHQMVSRALRHASRPGPGCRRAGLQRMNVERIDLMQFHWWMYEHPAYIDAMRELATLKEEGLLGAIGVTNFNTDHLRILVNTGIPSRPIRSACRCWTVGRFTTCKHCVSSTILHCSPWHAGRRLPVRTLARPAGTVDNRQSEQAEIQSLHCCDRGLVSISTNSRQRRRNSGKAPRLHCQCCGSLGVAPVRRGICHHWRPPGRARASQLDNLHLFDLGPSIRGRFRPARRSLFLLSANWQ